MSFSKANPFWQSYISAACADRQSSICLASRYNRRFCARGDGMPPCCLATGRWGAARHRLDTGMAKARSKGPCLLPGIMKDRQVDMTKIKYHYRNDKHHYVLDTNDWPLLYYDFIETCSFLQRPLPLLNKETVQEMVRTAPRIGLIKSPQVVICEKKVFLFLLTSFVKNFPLSIVLLTICEFVGLFEVFRPVIFIGTLCIFEYLRIRDWQPIS